MDRKDFLKHIVIGIVAVMGFGAILRAIASHRSTLAGASDDKVFTRRDNGK